MRQNARTEVLQTEGAGVIQVTHSLDEAVTHVCAERFACAPSEAMR